MRINTDGKKAYRNDLYEETARVLGENTKTGGIDAACIHAKQDVKGKEETMDYLSERLSPDELGTVAELLSTDEIEIESSYDHSITTDT
jgi:hypothetical protein